MMGVCESNGDRITDLPADVIPRILVLLPIKAAARTSVLSRNWRHRWRSIPQLVFDQDFADFSDKGESEWEVRSKQVLLNIYECLLHHDGPITEFELSIPGLVNCREIDLITLYLSKKGVQHFTLQFPCHRVGVVDVYRVHSSLFSALHLKSLTLESCASTLPSWFAGFRKLIDLQLYCVELPSDFFDKFLPKCPMLESLCVIQCGGAAGKLQIVAPFLKSFDFWGDIDICFKTPLLSKVSLFLTDKPDVVPNKLDMLSLFASLPRLQELCVNHEMLKYLAPGNNYPTRLPTPLHLLEVLQMNNLIFDGSEMERVFLCLIMSAPNLHSLTVQVSGRQLNVRPPNDGVTSIQRLLEAEVRPGSSDCLQHLREFTIKYSHGTQVELDLARFVLASAPLLRLVCVSPIYKLGAKEVAELMKELRTYKPVSKDAEIRCDWKYGEV